jgi:hypothetical protein
MENAMNHSGEQKFPVYLGVSLWISSKELSPDKITQILGLQPTYVRVRGAVIPGLGVNRRPEFDVHEWEFRKQLNVKPSDYIGHYSEKFITDFLNTIKDAAPRVKELSEDHSVTISLVYHVGDIPYIGLTRQHVHEIAALGARLDYDLMVKGSSSDETENRVSPVEVE